MPRIDAAVYDYRIEKARIAITLTLLGGERIRGHAFVQPSSYRYRGPETAIHLLNAPEPFLPLEVDDGEVLLVAKDRVVEVMEMEPRDDGDRAGQTVGARLALMQITLAGGVTYLGSMRLETPSSRPRLLDFLNQCTDRFVILYTTEGVRLINRALINRVRPLD